MIRGKKVLALALSVALTATMFAGCGAKKDSKKTDSKDGKNTLKVWSSAEDQDFMKEMSEKFKQDNSQYKDLEFKFSVVGDDKAKEQVEKDPKTVADVFVMASDQLGDLARGGYLRDLSTLESAGLKVEGVYEEQALESCKYDNKLYALPYTNNMLFLYYNKSLLTEEDVKSLETILAKPTAGEVKNFAVDIANGFYNNMFFAANGCELYGADGTDTTKVGWNTPEGVEVVKYLKTLKENPKFHKPANQDHENMLKSGRLAAYVGGGWDAANMKKFLGDNYAATTLPTVKLGGADKPLKPFAGFKLIAVNEATKNGEAAMRFAHYLNTVEAQKLRYEKRGYAPTAIELLSQTYDDPAIAASINQAKKTNSVLTPKAENFGNFWKAAETLGSAIYNGDASVADDAKIQNTLNETVTSMTAQVKK